MTNGDTLSRSQQLQTRTKQFALRVIRLVEQLPAKENSRILGRQLLRAGTSIGANYRAACRSRTSKEFMAKLRIVVEEADETVYWIELLVESRIVPARRLEGLLGEAHELLAIFAASLNTAARKARQSVNGQMIRSSDD